MNPTQYHQAMNGTTMPEPTSSIASAAQYGGSGAAVVFGLTTSEWSVIGVIAGVVIGLAGFAVNTVFQYLRWKREQDFLEASDDAR
jgi:hypothetical protein